MNTIPQTLVDDGRVDAGEPLAFVGNLAKEDAVAQQLVQVLFVDLRPVADLTESQARTQIVALQQQSAIEMERLLPTMQQAAQAIGPDAVIRVQAWGNELARTKLVVDEMAPLWNRIGESFGGALNGMITGAQTWRSAMSTLFQQVADAFLHPDQSATGYWCDIYYASTRVARNLLVSVDGARAMLPIPRQGGASGKVTEVLPFDHRLAQIFDTLGSLDSYMVRSGLTVAFTD